MSPSNTDVINDVYAAFGRGDIPALLGMLDENIAWRAPENLPHGGTFSGRDGAQRFFEGLGSTWDDLGLDAGDVLVGDDRVVVLARLTGRLRSTGEQTGYSSAHAWTLRDGVPVRFDEYVDAPVALPNAG